MLSDEIFVWAVFANPYDNQPPRVAFPHLPSLPALPSSVHCPLEQGYRVSVSLTLQGCLSSYRRER